MSSHRAERHRALRRRAAVADHSSLLGQAQGRLRAGAAQHKALHSRGRSGSVCAVLGGLAIVVAGVGAVATASTPADTHASEGDLPSLASLLAHRPAPGDGLRAHASSELSRSSERTAPPNKHADKPPEPDQTPSALQQQVEERAGVRAAAFATPVQGSAQQVAKKKETWALPVRHFYISTWFGERGWYWSSGYHTGIDFVAACGTRETAVTKGVVVRTGWDGPYGNQARLRLPNGDQVWYNHMIAIKTKVGATVPQGGLIGLMGETGNAYGCHLHFEYRVHGALKKPVDPAPYFAQHGIHLHEIQARLARH